MTEAPTRQRGWVIPLVGALINLTFAMVLIWLGIRYDDRRETPGALVWVGVLLLLPTWVRDFLLDRARARMLQHPELRLGTELAELARKHGSVTGVIEVVEPMLPPAADSTVAPATADHLQESNDG